MIHPSTAATLAPLSNYIIHCSPAMKRFSQPCPTTETGSGRQTEKTNMLKLTTNDQRTLSFSFLQISSTWMLLIHSLHKSCFSRQSTAYSNLSSAPPTLPDSEMTKGCMSWVSCQCQTLFGIIRIALTTCFVGKQRCNCNCRYALHFFSSSFSSFFYSREYEPARTTTCKRGALWSARARELWSSRANQRKTKAHNSRGLHSCWSAFNANRAYFHTPLIAWIDCLLNS